MAAQAPSSDGQEDADTGLGLLAPQKMAAIADAELARRVEPMLRERGLLPDGA